jgi:hypothetical protein
MIVLDLSILNQKGTPMFNSDTLANRPAAGIVGRIFIAIDSPFGIYRDTGTGWDQISGASTFSGSLATGQVAFGSATNTISGTNNLFWDNANGRLGIGTNAPANQLTLNNAGVRVFMESVGTFGYAQFGTSTNNPLYFTSNNTQHGRLTGSGNFILSSGTPADNGYKLQVAGGATFTAPIVATQASSDSGGIYYTRSFSHTVTPALSISTAYAANGSTDVAMCDFFDNNGMTGLGARASSYLRIMSERNPGAPAVSFTGTLNFINLTTNSSAGSFLSNSSTGNYNAINVSYTINRTGAGIMRGFYYNPTITSLGGSVHNAIQTTSGNVLFGSNFFWDNTNGSLGIGNNSIYAPTTFNLDVNGGLLVKNTAGRTAQITLINADPSLGGNNGFLVASVGGTSGGSFVDFQGYYGTSIVGSTALRLNRAGGAVIVNSTTNTGEQFQVTGTLRVNGQTSGSAGGNSGLHLIINCDGTNYKITLNNV